MGWLVLVIGLVVGLFYCALVIGLVFYFGPAMRLQQSNNRHITQHHVEPHRLIPTWDDCNALKYCWKFINTLNEIHNILKHVTYFGTHTYIHTLHTHEYVHVHTNFQTVYMHCCRGNGRSCVSPHTWVTARVGLVAWSPRTPTWYSTWSSSVQIAEPQDHDAPI